MKLTVFIGALIFLMTQAMGCSKNGGRSSSAGDKDTDTETDSDTDIYAGTDTDTDTDTNTDTDTDTGSDTEETDSGVNSDTGIFTRHWTPRFFETPSGGQTVTPPVNGTVTVSVDADDMVNRVLPTVFGNNIVAWRAATHDNTEVVRHLSNIDVHILRLPGGNWSNRWLWDGVSHWTLKESYLDSICSLPTITWSMKTDELFDIVASVDAMPQVCVNYSLARYIDEANPVQKAADYAADWVADLQEKGIDVEFWEVGNENYGKWQAGYEVGGVQITAQEYGEDFNVFADAMKAANPDIKIGAVIYPGTDSPDVDNWTQTVVSVVQDHADYLIAHEYFTWAPDLNTVTNAEVLARGPRDTCDHPFDIGESLPHTNGRQLFGLE